MEGVTGTQRAVGAIEATLRGHIIIREPITILEQVITITHKCITQGRITIQGHTITTHAITRRPILILGLAGSRQR